MILVTAALSSFDAALPEQQVRAERRQVAKRLWRGVAEDGQEFGFELAAPLRDGDVVHQSASARYVLRQEPEDVLEISLAIAPSAAAGIGWAVGNLHLELMSEPTRLLAQDEPAARQLLDRLGVPYTATRAVFRPGRFSRGASAVVQELGSSHRH